MINPFYVITARGRGYIPALAGAVARRHLRHGKQKLSCVKLFPPWLSSGAVNGLRDERLKLTGCLKLFGR